MKSDRIINLKRKRTGGLWLKALAVVLVAAVFTVAGIKAADEFGGKSAAEKALESSVCPRDMVFVTSPKGGFCIDKYEVSLSGDCPHPSPSSKFESQTDLEAPSCVPASKEAAIPWVNITQDQAARACAKAGKRLPTNSEWQQAALGTPDKASGWTASDCNVANNRNSQPGMTGSGALCISYAGSFDMIGNVWEWVSDTVTDGRHGDRVLPKEGFIQSMSEIDAFPDETSSVPDPIHYNDYYWVKETGNRGVVRGGYWDNKSEAGQYSVYAVNKTEDVGKAIGFRCVK